MASTYTANKAHLEMPASGDQVDSWAATVNQNSTDIDDAIGGTEAITVTTADVTLTTAQTQKMRLSLSGALTGNRSVITPSGVGGFWLVTNNCTGGYTVTVKTSGGTGIPVQGGGLTTIVYSDGTNTLLADNGPLVFYVPTAGGTMTGTLNCASNGLNVGSGQLLVTGGNVTLTGSLTAAGNITAFSDRRLKTDIEKIENAVRLVRRLEGVRYLDMAGNRSIGVIAQDVKAVLPEVVFENEEGYMHVAYQNMIAVLINAINELSARVEYLEAHK